MSEENGDWIGNKHCIGSEVEGKKDCKSSDALGCYEHLDDDGTVWYDGYCRSCNQVFTREEVHGSSLAPELGVDPTSGEVTERIHFEKQPKKDPITIKEAKEFIASIGYVSNNYRGIRDDISEFFGHLTELDENNKVKARYYPETLKGKIQGYKCRNHPKNFRYGNRGSTGSTNDLSGMSKFRGGGRTVIIVGGEEDKAAAYQMLLDYYKSRDQEHFVPAVVSPTTGEGSAPNQLKRNYEYLDQFENIILGYDNDTAGIEAAKNSAKVLPKGKVKIATWSGGDPNAMLQKKQSKLFISNYFEAKELVSSGIKTSNDLDEEVIKALLAPKIPLPSFMSELEDRMAGGIPTGEGAVIVNITAETGVGKTTTINEMIYHWIFNSPVQMGVVTLELNAGQYGLAMLSRHIGKKLQLYKVGQEAVDYLNTPEVVAKRKELWQDEHGAPRWHLLDERDGTLEQAQKQCELLYKKYGCTLIVLDPIQDLLDGSSNEEQSVFMKWQKAMVKEGVTFININHTRKVSSTLRDKEGNIILRELREDDIMGTSAIAKSGAANIFCIRDKHSDDNVVKNTTIVSASKIRWSGWSGNCGYWYYDNQTHTMYDKNTFFKEKEVSLKPKVKRV